MKDLEVLAGWNFSPNLGIQRIFSFNYFFFSSIVRTVLFHGNLLLNPIGFRLYFSPIYFFPPMNEELQVQFSSVTQSCPTVCDPWNAAHQASLSITNSRSPPNPMSIELVMPPTISSSVVPFSSALNLSQHQGLFQWVSSLHQGVTRGLLIIILFQERVPYSFIYFLFIVKKNL